MPGPLPMKLLQSMTLAHILQDCLQRLVEQLIHLQKEHSALLENYENLSEELQLSMNERDRLQQKLVALKDQTLKVHLLIPVVWAVTLVHYQESKQMLAIRMLYFVCIFAKYRIAANFRGKNFQGSVRSDHFTEKTFAKC